MLVFWALPLIAREAHSLFLGLLGRYEFWDGVENGFERGVVFGFGADEIGECGAFSGEVVVGGEHLAEAGQSRTLVRGV